MIPLKNFAPQTKNMGSSFMKSIYIFDIFDHLRAKILAPGELTEGP